MTGFFAKESSKVVKIEIIGLYKIILWNWLVLELPPRDRDLQYQECTKAIFNCNPVGCVLHFAWDLSHVVL